MIRTANCGECAFWQRDAGRNGSCRRNAPSPGAKPDEVSHWPATSERQWCGDGIARTGQPPALVSCGACRFWQTNPGGGLDPQDRKDEFREWWNAAGHCVRHAPQPSFEAGCRGFWRATHVKDSCGEGETA